ncbi:MAG: hypothetical protein ACPG4T_17960 [Nannocystaceae bacterium]
MLLVEARGSQYSLEPMILKQGTSHVEVVEPGDAIILTTISGTVRVTRKGRDRLERQAVPGQPLFLFIPGRYQIHAVTRVWGLRGARCMMIG